MVSAIISRAGEIRKDERRIPWVIVPGRAPSCWDSTRGATPDTGIEIKLTDIWLYEGVMREGDMVFLENC